PAQLERILMPRCMAIVLGLAVCACYFVLFQGLAGTSCGKALYRLRVLRRDGRSLGLGLAALRYLVYLLDAKLLYGSFTIPFDPQRRALHDMVCGTNVFRAVRWR